MSRVQPHEEAGLFLSKDKMLHSEDVYYSLSIAVFLSRNFCIFFVVVFQCRLKDDELRVYREQLSEVERDLQVAEQEKENMHKKVELLEKALESPGSKITLRRILERSAIVCFSKKKFNAPKYHSDN